ncbi:unnamed protein product [Diatraea saccharalis]|uniref:Carboxylesterase type B domain-containing protein n=1 Tax=Diatraea saccharalis TaxID=40085 RepID=A0A9N9WIW2_9NEOP|nr:unnamed protein product [Diatraea saccharalis]
MFCEVSVEQGVLRGIILEAFDGRKYYSFEGIPYAKPPIGELRFRNPQPPDTWTNVRDCTKPGNKCAQINPLSGKGFEGSEDCLYLNIYTPCLPVEKLEKLPVIFFIHGGRLLVGYGDYYRPDYFLRHDVILVTVNYRLNVLGYLCLAIPEAPGNVGMKDCAVALRWVKRNIEKFNGDSNNITVFGESAGAAIATTFLTSEMTVGLFHKLIAQSGNHIADIFPQEYDHISVARHIASIIGKDLEDVSSIYEFLRNTPVEKLVTAYICMEMERPNYSLSPVCMYVIEKEFDGVEQFLNKNAQDSMRNNDFQKVPTLVGSNIYEAAMFVRQDENGILYEKDLKFVVPRCLHLNESSREFRMIVEAIKNFYFKDKEIGDSTKEQYVLMISDALFQRDIIYFTELVAKYNKEVFMYSFHYIGNLNNNVTRDLKIKGTTHGDLIQYQFYRKSKSEKCTQKDWKIINFLSETWCNFARYGKPMCNNQTVKWLPYSQKKRLTFVVDEVNRLVENEDYARYKFWNNLCELKAHL